MAAPDVLVACKALYVLEVTRARADWAATDVEGDATFAGPEAVIVQVSGRGVCNIMYMMGSRQRELWQDQHLSSCRGWCSGHDGNAPPRWHTSMAQSLMSHGPYLRNDIHAFEGSADHDNGGITCKRQPAACGRLPCCAPCPIASWPQVQRLPSSALLSTLKDCLDYCSSNWVDMFVRLDGVELLRDVVALHAQPARWGARARGKASAGPTACPQALPLCDCCRSGGGGLRASAATWMSCCMP